MPETIGGILAGQDFPPASKTISVSPFLSQGPKRLLSLIQWFKRTCGDCFPKQKFLAVRLKVAVSSVKRYLSELVSAGLVKVLRRGRRGSQYTPVNKPVEAVEITSEEPVHEPDSEPDLTRRTYLLNSENKNLATPAGEKLSSRVRNALGRAARRIARARNPEAYRRAIIGVESRLEALQGAPELPKRREVSSAEAATPWRPVSGGLSAHLSALGIPLPGALLRRLA